MKPQIVNTKMNRFEIKSKFIKAAMFAMSILMVSLMMGTLYFRDRVYIYDNGEMQEIMTSDKDAYAILREAEYTLSPHDRVDYKEIDESTAHIIIHRAFDVTVIADGKTVTVPMLEGTAAQALEKAGVELGADDMVDCSLDDEVTPDAVITVTRVEYRSRQNTSEIAFETTYIDNSNLVIGEERVITEGENGELTYYITEKYVDGKLTEQTLSREETTKEPVAQVIERGTALAEPYAKMDNPETLELVNGLPTEYTRVISGKATAYTAGYNALTASGRRAEIGTAAVNPNVIPYGSELYIVSQDGSKVYGYAIAADTGIGLMDGTVAIDLYFGNKYEYYDDSCRWGAVQVDIYVLTEGSGY